MKEAVYVNDIKEEIREECFSDCKFEDPYKNELDVIQTPEYVKSEFVGIKYEPLETISCLVVKDESQQNTQIKKCIKDKCFGDSENGDFQIIKVDEVNSINTVEDIKPEEIDIKDEHSENIRFLSTGNGGTFSVTSSDMLEHKDLILVDGKTTASNTVMNYKDDTEANISANMRCLETPMYECSICQYKTRWKSNLPKHMFIHKDPSKTAIYECNICQFETRWKLSLQRHMLVHTDSPKALKYECNICPYKTWRKGSLQSHMLVHTAPSKTTKYDCSTCGYKTWRKSNLQKHLLVHTDPSKREMYECYTCGFKTRWKSNLPNHMLVHTDLSKAVMYKCDTCSYKTWRKSHFRRHLLVHADLKRKNV